MSSGKKIASIRVIEPGSAPDVDSDFATYCRDDVLAHVEELYGRGTLSNIVTFNTVAAKGSFKAMCTIYQKPFAEANKIAGLIPPPIEGVEVTIAEIFNSNHERYSESADFRAAVSTPEWEPIIEGAKAMEGRNKSSGVHPCGVIISSKKLEEVIPLQIRQSDNRLVSQWTYPELEAMGLIKFDFLGLDTVDLIQHSVEYIRKNGKPVPNMMEIIHGPMDDPQTYKMISRGDTIGIFQLASPGVQDLLKRMQPTEIADITATTALYRPGPMGMKSHIKYADRKNGREPVEFIHKDFENSPLVEILGDTYGLIVYQEQILKISNQICGMTLQEGDDLRKAMGKKKMAVMMKMKPKFIEGGIQNAYSEEAMNILWSTCEEFAKYGFNLSHSVAYAMNAYQAAYLKANYPVEFMAALIAQNTDNKDKILVFLQEARKMGLKVGSVDVNISDVRVSPDYTGNSGFDIVYGFSGINAVSSDVAAILVREREENGPYKSVQDMINRCSPLGVSNKKVYENIALAGGFDSFGLTRQSIVENLPSMIGESKVQVAKGASLFDMFGGPAEETINTINFDAFEEYPHLEKLKKEAAVIGLYLTSHPLENAGSLAGLRTTTIGKLLKSKENAKVKLVGSLTDFTVKRQRRGKAISITLDDGTGYVTGFLSKEIVKGLDKRVAQKRVQALYESGSMTVPIELEETILLDNFEPKEELENGAVYSVTLAFRPGTEDNPYNARILEINEVKLADNGSLPIRIRLPKPESTAGKTKQVDAIKQACENNPGDYPIFVTYVPKDFNKLLVVDNNSVYIDAIDAIKAGEEVLSRGEIVDDMETSLEGERIKAKGKKKKVDTYEEYREWPPPTQNRGGIISSPMRSKNYHNDISNAFEKLDYKKTKFKADKNTKLARDLELAFGIENYDFGVFNADILNDD